MGNITVTTPECASACAPTGLASCELLGGGEADCHVTAGLCSERGTFEQVD